MLGTGAIVWSIGLGAFCLVLGGIAIIGIIQDAFADIRKMKDEA